MKEAALPLLARLARALDTDLNIAFAPRNASEAHEARLHDLGLSVTTLRDVLDVRFKLSALPLPKTAAFADLARIKHLLNQAVHAAPAIQLVDLTEELARARVQLEELTAAVGDAEDEARRLEDA